MLILTMSKLKIQGDASPDTCFIRKIVENPNYLTYTKMYLDFSDSKILLNETAIYEFGKQISEIDSINSIDEMITKIESSLGVEVEVRHNSEKVKQLANDLVNELGQDGLHRPDNLHMAFSIINKTTLLSCDGALIHCCEKKRHSCIHTNKMATDSNIKVKESKFEKLVRAVQPKVKSTILKPGQKIVWRSFV